MISAAARWEEIIVGNLPSVPTAALESPPNPPDIRIRNCTAYPNVIDDIYLCVQNVLPSETAVAFGGFYRIRDIDKINPRTGKNFMLPYAGNIGISDSFLDAATQDFQNIILHELGHALGL